MQVNQRSWIVQNINHLHVLYILMCGTMYVSNKGFCLCCFRTGGGDSNIKKVGVLVVSLRGVNFRFWSRLGC